MDLCPALCPTPSPPAVPTRRQQPTRYATALCKRRDSGAITAPPIARAYAHVLGGYMMHHPAPTNKGVLDNEPAGHLPPTTRLSPCCHTWLMMARRWLLTPGAPLVPDACAMYVQACRNCDL
jgi:hypothetical protein